MADNVKQADIIVSGGGTPGLTLAILLGRLGLDVAVIDPAPPQQTVSETDTRTSALMTGSVNILKATGVWEACEPHAGTMSALRIIDGEGNEPVSVDFRAAEIGQDIFGMNISNALLRVALLDEARRIESISLHMPGRLASFAADDFGVTAHLDDGQALRGRLLVGADGRGSPTREAAEIDVRRKDYRQKAITCFISHDRDHHDASAEFHRPGGPFTLVPLPGKRSSVVWVECDNDAERFFRLDRQSFEKALQEQTNDLFGTVTLDRPPQLWPLSMLKAHRLTAARVALAAEAAHVVHPLGAQGLNLSLRDVASLAEIIADSVRTGIDPGCRIVLDRYEKTRRSDIAGRVWGSHILNHFVSTPAPLFGYLRKTGMKTIDSLPPLKRHAMRQGMAPAACSSRLAQGKTL